MIRKYVISIIYMLGFIILGTSSTFAAIKSTELTPQTREIKVQNNDISMPTLSPNLKYLAFLKFSSPKTPSLDASFESSSEGILWMLNIENGSIKKLSNEIILDDEPHVSWSPDSSSIVFGTNGEIWIADIINKENIKIQKPKNIKKNKYSAKYDNYFHSPAYSPDGKTIAIRNVYDIWLYNIGTNSYQIIYSPQKELLAGKDTGDLPKLNWSHNSQILAFDQMKFLKPQGELTKRYIEGIAEIDIEGKKTKAIVGIDSNIEYLPVFSQDNCYVSFLSRPDWDTKPSIYVNDIKTNKSFKIVDCEDECYMLSWTENNLKLIFATNKALWFVNLKDISKPVIEKRITIRGINDLSDIFWFPKGETLYFLKPIKSGKYTFGSLKKLLEK